MKLTVIALLLSVILLSVASPAAAVDIEFKVRMGMQMQLGAFDPGADFVDLAGTFNDWGSAPLTPLSDADGDSIYSIVLSGFNAGEVIEFKFRLNGQWGGTEEFPGWGSNRIYAVQDSSNEIDVWYNDFAPGGGTAETGELGWWNDTVFYEIFVRSFQDSDGDGIGDLPGLTARLDYLNDGDPATTDDLGITGIWLMPINDAPSYHGYDSTDYRSINPDYGTMADFEAFLAAAHARGIRVIIDYVMNHCSNQHPWFQASAAGDPTYRDWFRWSESDPGETGPWGQQVWHPLNSDWYYGLFWGGMPDLNYDTQAVKDEMFDTATFWLDTIGVDGFRLDAILYIDEDGSQHQTTPGTLDFWHEYNTHVKSVKSDMMSVGEAWTATSNVYQYVIEDRLDICFEFDLSYATVGAANNADAGYLGGKASQVYNLYPYLQFATFLTNHDQDRSFTVFGEDAGKARVAAGIYLSLPGVPFLYYGEEISMTGSGAHENIRTPMQWTDGLYAGFSTGTPWWPVNGNYTTSNVADFEADPNSLLEWYKKLVHVRNGSSALRRGTHAPLGSSATPVLAFARTDSLQTLLCLANTSGSPQSGLTVSGLEGVLSPGAHTLVDLLDPAHVLDVAVNPLGEITGLSLAGYGVRTYEVTRVSAVEPGTGDLPRAGLRLEQNHPNPFNPSTTIRYALPERSHVKIGVYDLAGREVTLLADGIHEKGPGEVRWNGMDHRGQAMGAGVYFVRLESKLGTLLNKMTLVK